METTQGQMITYDGAPINAFFHSNSGGTTETASNVWGGTNYPYLQVVETARRRCILTIQLKCNTYKRRSNSKNKRISFKYRNEL